MKLEWCRKLAHQITSLQFHPFDSGTLVCALAANYGFYQTGNTAGSLVLFTRNYSLSQDTWAAPCDIEFAPWRQTFLVAAFNDGSIAGFDALPDESVSEAKRLDGSLRCRFHLRSHSADASGVTWNRVDRVQFASCSWDGTVQLYDVAREGVMRTMKVSKSSYSHGKELFDIKFCPVRATVLLCATAQGSAVVLDTRAQAAGELVHTNNRARCRCVDWATSLGESNYLTGGRDGCAAVWDLRSPNVPVIDAQVHTWGITRIACAPSFLTISRCSEVVALTASFDMTARVCRFLRPNSDMADWSVSRMNGNEAIRHSEFVTGVGWNHAGSHFATGGWDNVVKVYKFTTARPEGLISKL